jgi:hypothetical protein
VAGAAEVLVVAEEGVKAGASGLSLALELLGEMIDSEDAEMGMLPADVEAGMSTGCDAAVGKGDLAPSLRPLADLEPPTEFPLLDADAAVLGTGGMSLRSEIIFCKLFRALLMFA